MTRIVSCNLNKRLGGRARSRVESWLEQVRADVVIAQEPA